MGDKSPKSKSKQLKQDTAQKNQKSKQKADAFAKAHPAKADPPGKKKK